MVDCDVHQGDGTAQIFAEDPRTFTLSLHGARNYPFSRVPPTSTSTSRPAPATRATCARWWRRSTSPWSARGPTSPSTWRAPIPWEGDRLGRLALTKPGLRARDELVLDRLAGAGAAVCVVLAGGYAEDIRDTVDINAATAAAVAERVHVPTPG